MYGLYSRAAYDGARTVHNLIDIQYKIFNYFTGSAAGLLHHNHQTGQDNSSNLDGNIKNSGNGSDNITAENETDNATADESSNGPIKVSIVMTVALREELLLNPFKTTAYADSAIPRVPKSWV